MEKLSSSVLKLKVKTVFIMSDDLDEVVDDKIEKAKIELIYGKIVNQT
jgi:hypothetical protein